MKNLILIFVLLLSTNSVQSQNKDKSVVSESIVLTKDLTKVKAEMIVTNNNAISNSKRYYKNNSQEIIELEPTMLLYNYQSNIKVEALKTNEKDYNSSTNSFILDPVKLTQNYVHNIKVEIIKN